jgi:outer membrane protein assembly factor BamB
VRIGRRVLVLGAALAVTATLAAPLTFPAAAVEPAPALVVRPPVGAPTSLAIVSGTGFLASERVAIRFDTKMVREVRADGSGAFRTRVRIPRAAGPGDHGFLAVGLESGSEVTAPFEVHTNWPQFMRTKRRAGFNPMENVISTGNVASLQVKWRGPLTSELATGVSPLAVDGVVYMAGGHAFDEGTIRAFPVDCAEACRPLWTCCANSWLFTPSVVDGTMFDGRLGTLYAYDTEDCADGTCDPLWTADSGNYVATSPVVADGRVYVATCGFCKGLPSSVMIRAFDAETGNVLWSAPGNDVTNSAPTVSGGVVYLGDDVGIVYAFDAVDGTLLWRADAGGGVWAPLIIVNDTLFAYQRGGTLLAFDPSGCGAEWCDPLWQGTVDYGEWSAPAAGGGMVFVPTRHGTVFAFDAHGCGDDRCDPVWSWTLPTVTQSAAAVGGDVLYVTGENQHLYAFDVHGCGSSECPPIADIAGAGSSSPIVVDGTVLVAENGRLTALAPQP